jgi:hypothetical protein
MVIVYSAHTILVEARLLYKSMQNQMTPTTGTIWTTGSWFEQTK